MGWLQVPESRQGLCDSCSGGGLNHYPVLGETVQRTLSGTHCPWKKFFCDSVIRSVWSSCVIRPNGFVLCSIFHKRLRWGEMFSLDLCVIAMGVWKNQLILRLPYARCFTFFAAIFSPSCSSAATGITLLQLTLLGSIVAHDRREMIRKLSLPAYLYWSKFTKNHEFTVIYVPVTAVA